MSTPFGKRHAFALLVLAGITICLPRAGGAWTQDRFVIGSWWGPCESSPGDTTDAAQTAVDLARFQQYKDAYFNLHTGTPGTATPAYRLYLAQHVGIKTLVPGIATSPYDSTAAAGVVSGYSSHPAFYGYFLKDEPAYNDPDLETYKSWTSYYRRHDPEHLAFINLYPWPVYPTQYEAYLDQWLNDPDPTRMLDFASFDHYPFSKDAQGQMTTSQSYFLNHQIVRRMAGARPVWAYPASIDWQQANFYPQDESMMRFMAFCPVAYGVKGIVWFTYRRPTEFDPPVGPPDPCVINPGLPYCGPYYTAPIIMCDSVSWKYAAVQRINRYLAEIVGPVVMLSDSTIATVHKSSAPTGETIDPAGLLNANTPIVADLSDSSSLVGIFKGPAPGTNYLFLVNKNLSTRNAGVWVKGDYRNRVWLAPRVGSYNGDSTYTGVPAIYSASTNRTSFGFALDGGEGVLIMLKRRARTDYDGDLKADLSVRTTSGTWQIDYSGNSFGSLDFTRSGYGGSSDMPCPADYDGDGKSDLAVLASSGTWQIDFASNGFNGWDASFAGHGGGTPVPGDYDDDGKADLAINTSAGVWKVDYAGNGFTGWELTTDALFGGYSTQVNGAYGATAGDFDGDGYFDISGTNGSTSWKIAYWVNGWGGWDVTRTFSSMTFQPAAADYDGDGKTDIALYASDKKWYIDYASGGFGTWGATVSTGQTFNSTRAVPADYDGDGKADIAVKTNSGDWKIDYAANGFGSWDATYSGFGGSSSQGQFRSEAYPSVVPLKPALRVTPNPFTHGTTLQLTLPAADRVRASVFDVSGREVANVVDRELPAGITEVAWDGRDAEGRPCRNGVYFVRVRSQQLNVQRKLVVLAR